MERVQYAQAAMPFKLISKLMIVHLVATALFWINYFPLQKPRAVLSNTKGSINLFIVTVVEYKKFFQLQLVKYVQVRQEDEPRNTMDIDQIVREIFL